MPHMLQHKLLRILDLVEQNRVQNNSLTKDIFWTKTVCQGMFTFAWTKCLKQTKSKGYWFKPITSIKFNAMSNLHLHPCKLYHVLTVCQPYVAKAILHTAKCPKINLQEYITLHTCMYVQLVMCG